MRPTGRASSIPGSPKGPRQPPGRNTLHYLFQRSFLHLWAFRNLLDKFVFLHPGIEAGQSGIFREAQKTSLCVFFQEFFLGSHVSPFLFDKMTVRAGTTSPVVTSPCTWRKKKHARHTLPLTTEAPARRFLFHPVSSAKTLRTPCASLPGEGTGRVLSRLCI
jgi:hypothetical protein